MQTNGRTRERGGVGGPNAKRKGYLKNRRASEKTGLALDAIIPGPHSIQLGGLRRDKGRLKKIMKGRPLVKKLWRGACERNHRRSINTHQHRRRGRSRTKNLGDRRRKIQPNEGEEERGRRQMGFSRVTPVKFNPMHSGGGSTAVLETSDR